MKWGEGSELSEVFSSKLQRSFILYTREMKIETCFESRGWLAASFVTTLLMFQWTMNQEWRFCPIQLFLVCFTECMSKVFLKFWVEQSELMDWNEKNGGTFPQPFSQESVWMVVFDRKQKPLKSSLSTSFFLYLSLSVEGEGNVLPLEFWQTLVRFRFTISGCERECVQRLMRRKYSDFQPLRGREKIFPWRWNMEHYNRRSVWVRNFLPHNIGVGVRSKKRQRKTGSGNKKCFL